MAKRSLLTKHGKFYEINPYKVIERLEDIKELLFDDYSKDDDLDRLTLIRLVGEIDDLIEQMYEEGQLPR